MWRETITPDDVRGRARVDSLAQRDPELALKAAKAIKHPWYRCQSLSAVACHIEGNRKLVILKEAVEVAKQQTEINRIVTVSAWPMRQLAKVSPDFAKAEISWLVDLANSEPHTLRRADALFVLAQSVSGFPSQLNLIIPSLVRALLNGHGWRIDRLIRESIDLVEAVQPEALPLLVEQHSEGAKKRQLSLRVGENQI